MLECLQSKYDLTIHKKNYMLISMRYIILEQKEKIAKIILNKPPLNILNIEMMEEIDTCFNQIKKSGNKLLIISGSGKCFSAGVDISEHMGEKIEKMLNIFHKICLDLYQFPLPSISAVRGPTLGGACELALCSDFVIASNDASFGFPEIKVGVFPPVGVVILPELIGTRRTYEMLLTGEAITAPLALNWGLINKVTNPDDLEKEIDSFAEKMLKLSPAVTKIAKKAIISDIKEKLKLAEEIYLKELMATEDANEGLRAFLEKRRPVWKNK